MKNVGFIVVHEGPVIEVIDKLESPSLYTLNELILFSGGIEVSGSPNKLSSKYIHLIDPVL